MERALSSLPKDDVEVETEVQRQLLKRLSDMRYNPPPTTQAARPRKADKLPPGASYTVSGGKGRVSLAGNASDAEGEAVDNPTEAGHSGTGTKSRKRRAHAVDTDTSDSDSGSGSGSSSGSDSSSEDEEESRRIKNVGLKLAAEAKKRRKVIQKLTGGDVQGQGQGTVQGQGQEQAEVHVEEEEEENVTWFQGDYPVGAYVVALYQDSYYVGQVLNKDQEPDADKEEEYILCNFMENLKGDILKWPSKVDHLNTHKVRYPVPYVLYR